MMDKKLFRGELVRLATEEPDQLAESISRWARDSEYWRLGAGDAARLFSAKKTKTWIEKDIEEASPNDFFFTIRTLTDDRLIGIIALDDINWAQGESFVGIGLGEREFWGKGYGTDAMRLILRYAFTELNLRRVSLNVFGYNQRGIRSYEKCGFKHEGAVRQWLHRDGQRWDLVHMGILREEFLNNA
jgi:RimJ/RimL family protein N-acetyltransferase